MDEYLLRNVLENPADDIPRLVLSDWWDENGQAERAEFCRIQCAISVELRQTIISGNDRLNALKRRERDLFESMGANPFNFCPMLCSVGIEPTRKRSDLPYPTGFIQRGFVSEIELVAAQFLVFAREMFERGPIQHVTLTDKTTLVRNADSILHCWQRFSTFAHAWQSVPTIERRAYAIPDELFDLIDGKERKDNGAKYFAGEKEAQAALSAACVKLGRRLAGLSEIREGKP
jgi:uncharacterized protein (TIGR02996 family)